VELRRRLGKLPNLAAASKARIALSGVRASGSIR
jgi:hypothetical protein